jgi:hypothetical protein
MALLTCYWATLGAAAAKSKYQIAPEINDRPRHAR